MRDFRFPILPVPLRTKERARIKRELASQLEGSPKRQNGGVLGPIFGRLIRAFEFEWAWGAFTSISRHDSMTGKFAPHLELVGEIVGQHFAVGQIEQIYDLMQECPREGWTLQLAIVPMTLGFARRPDSMAWIPILHRVASAVKKNREYLDNQIELALQMIADSEWGSFPHANEPFLSGVITSLYETHRVEKWTYRMGEIQESAEEHERRVELIHQAIETAHISEHPSAAMAEAVVALVKLNECARVETLLTEVLTFNAAESKNFLLEYLRRDTGGYELQKFNHVGALKSLGAIYLRVLAKGAIPPSDDRWHLDWMYENMGHSSLRVGMLGWWLETTERAIQAMVQEGRLEDLAPRIENLASKMNNQSLLHVPDDFWRSFAEAMPTADLKSVILSKLAVRDAKME